MLLRTNSVTFDTIFPYPYSPRRFRGPFFGLIALGAILVLFRLSDLHVSISNDWLVLFQDLLKPDGGWLPPRFFDWHELEKQLPQLDLDLPYPQGREGRYIRFSNHVWGAFRPLGIRPCHETQLKPFNKRPRMGKHHARVNVECTPRISYKTNVRVVLLRWFRRLLIFSCTLTIFGGLL
jgi:hypothetical protein